MTSSRSPYQHRLQMLALRRHLEILAAAMKEEKRP